MFAKVPAEVRHRESDPAQHGEQISRPEDQRCPASRITFTSAAGISAAVCWPSLTGMGLLAPNTNTVGACTSRSFSSEPPARYPATEAKVPGHSSASEASTSASAGSDPARRAVTSPNGATEPGGNRSIRC